MTTISVCLPTYNGARYVARAIESVLSQTYQDYELIIADDGSSDSTPEIARQYAATDKRIQFIQNSQNLGLFQNYNYCLSEARGTFIKPFAQDDLLEPRMFERFISIFTDHPEVSLVSCAKHIVDDSEKCIETIQQFKTDTQITGGDVITYNMVQLNNWVGEPSTVMFRSQFRGTGFDTNLFHYGDIDYWFRIVEGHEYLYIAEPLCAFRRHKGSATSKNHFGLYFALDIFRMGEKYRNYLQALGETPEHFARRAIEQIALQVDHLVREEGLTPEKCLNARPSQMPIDEAGAFKQLSFHSARRVTELLAEISALQHQKEDIRKHYEKQLADMRSSTSWKITAPLRAIKP